MNSFTVVLLKNVIEYRYDVQYMQFFCVDHNTKSVHSENQNEFSIWEEYADSESVEDKIIIVIKTYKRGY